MWKSEVAGKVLHFRLVGLNNQNFIMEDTETGTWWQQVTGEAILGPLKGEKLERASFDLLTFATWREENPDGAVLEPDENYRDRYPASTWDESPDELPEFGGEVEGPFATRDLIVGVSVDGRSKAYRMKDLIAQNPVSDRIGSARLLIVVAADGRSLRCFNRVVDGEELELFMKPDAEKLTLVDTATGSEWSFQGEAVSGALTGKRLEEVPFIQDFWFDWKIYHPDTGAYTAGR